MGGGAFGPISTGLEHRCNSYLNNFYIVEVCNSLLVISGWQQLGSGFSLSSFTQSICNYSAASIQGGVYTCPLKANMSPLTLTADTPLFYFPAVTNRPEFLTFCESWSAKPDGCFSNELIYWLDTAWLGLSSLASRRLAPLTSNNHGASIPGSQT